MIRRYHPTDLERIKEITARAFESVSIDRNIEAKFGLIGGREWRWRKLQHIDADATGEGVEGIFVAEADGVVVGFITCRADAQSRIGRIANMAVAPEHQGRGTGRALMEAALEHLRGRGMEGVRIETLEQNEVGARFYVSMGFHEVARQIHYYLPL